MLDAGEDPRFIARRLAILASEDIGNADPRGIMVAQAAWDLTERIGMPEARITLSQCACYLALAPKSNAAYMAINAAMEDVAAGRVLPVPMHLRDPNTSPVSDGDGIGPAGAEGGGGEVRVFPQRRRAGDRAGLPGHREAVLRAQGHRGRGRHEAEARRHPGPAAAAARGARVSVAGEKSALRAALRARVAAMGESDRERASEAVRRGVLGSSLWAEAGVVMVFAADATEPDLDGLIHAGVEAGKVVCVPRVDWAEKRLTASPRAGGGRP
jgi:hypothetical protein